MSFPRYDEYKDSGVEWLGEVPAHWEVARIKSVSTCNDEVLPEATAPETEIEYVEISDVTAGKGITSSTALQFSAAPSRARRIIRDGDVIVSTVRTYLRAIAPVHRPPENMVVSTGFAVIRPNAVATGYAGYLFQSEFLIDEIISRSVGVSYPAINASDLMALKVPLPTPAEQTAIATFLDRETAKIDDLVAEQQNLIALLKEKRQALISHAVTKGLDPNVPMKDSGVEWLGEVPAHWEVVRFQRVVFVAEGQVDPEQEPYRSMVLIAPNHVESGTGRILLLATAEEQSAESGKYLCQSGDVIYSKIRPALRKACIAPEQCLCSADMYPLRGNERLENAYLYWFLLTEQFSTLSVLESERVAMPKINRESLKAVWLTLPPRSEQLEIAAHLSHEAAKIDDLIAEALSTISLLQERRTALISAAVTGKIDVRNVVSAQEKATA